MISDQPAGKEHLQFEQMELEETENEAFPGCGRCSKAIVGSYYEAGGKMICSTCKNQIGDESAGGSGIVRFFRSAGLGVPAAVVGAGIYYGISALTGYEFGLVAIVIGLLVGGAVRIGSNGRGGWLYQTLAIVLTYCAIASTYIPYIIEGLKNELPAEQQELGLTDNNPAAKATPEMSALDADQVNGVQPTAGDATQGAAVGYDENGFQPVIVVGAYMVLFLFAMAAPFLAGFENIIGLIIIGIGLYEAWKLNKRTVVHINGPFDLAPRQAVSEN